MCCTRSDPARRRSEPAKASQHAFLWGMRCGTLCQVPVEPQDPQYRKPHEMMGGPGPTRVEAFASSSRALLHRVISCKRPGARQTASECQEKHATSSDPAALEIIISFRDSPFRSFGASNLSLTFQGSFANPLVPVGVRQHRQVWRSLSNKDWPGEAGGHVHTFEMLHGCCEMRCASGTRWSISGRR